jgi:uncharacterized membrane protein
MSGVPRRWPSIVSLVASLLGLTFGSLSTIDYSKHLDRQVHGIHCSFIPGLPVDSGGESACRTAMYSPYAALFRDKYWGGIPISLFAVGAFAFFAAFALYLVVAGPVAPRRATKFFGVVSFSPLVASALMFAISALELGQFCKTCVGIYIASVMLAIGGIGVMVEGNRKSPVVVSGDKPEDGEAQAAAGKPQVAIPEGALWLVPIWFVALGISAITPALLYVSALPSYANYISDCGKLPKPGVDNPVLLHVKPAGATQQATLFVDPLCPTCKAFHKRLIAEKVIDQLDTTLVLFPLDNECNWMLDRALHPGSCLVSKAVLCADRRAFEVLEWAYDNQDKLLEGAKAEAGLVNVRAAIREKWGNLDACIDSKDTKVRLEKMLHYIVDNKLPVSTPQLFLGDTRLCDEDSDIGLAFTLRKLAPNLRQP